VPRRWANPSGSGRRARRQDRPIEYAGWDHSLIDQDDPEQRIAELERQLSDAKATAGPTAETTQRSRLTAADIRRLLSASRQSENADTTKTKLTPLLIASKRGCVIGPPHL
jgi:hypothetical protein